MKYIYLIQSLENSYYKIGISNNPNIRIMALQTGNSSILKLITVFKSEYANLVEKTMHNKYSHLRKEGEWFDLTINEEISFIEDCKKIESGITYLKKNGNEFI